MVAGSTLCMVRETSFLPVLAAIFLDIVDMTSISEADIEEVILHELGHALGVGSIWLYTGFLAQASLGSPGADTHFLGTHAIEAFDSAGGTTYAGARVPVENTMGYGSADTHWRESVMGVELMTPLQHRGQSDPFSAVTIESMADLGYAVDASLADDYELEQASANSAGDDEPSRSTIDLRGDFRPGTVTIVDADGQVVRTIAPR